MAAFRDFCEEARKHDVDMVFSDVIRSRSRLIPAVSHDSCTYCFIPQRMKTGDSTWTLDSPNYLLRHLFYVLATRVSRANCQLLVLCHDDIDLTESLPFVFRNGCLRRQDAKCVRLNVERQCYTQWNHQFSSIVGWSNMCMHHGWQAGITAAWHTTELTATDTCTATGGTDSHGRLYGNRRHGMKSTSPRHKIRGLSSPPYSWLPGRVR